jgi:hypothetical protein
MKSRLDPAECDFRLIRDEVVAPCHDWEFSRTATPNAKPGVDIYSGILFDAPWPKYPFLSLDKKEQDRIAQDYHYHRGLWPFDFKHLAKNFEDLQSETSSHIPVNEAGVYAALFQIDWTSSDKNLAECFKLWLEQNRPKDVVQKEARGRGGPLARMKEDLEALGVYRIIACHKPEPITELIAIYGNAMAARFQDDAAWSRAKKRAQDVLELFRCS